MTEQPDKTRTSGERYLGIAQEVYLHLVKSYDATRINQLTPTEVRSLFGEFAIKADEAAAAFNSGFETDDY